LPIFCEKVGVFLKNQCCDNFFSDTNSSLNKKTPTFCQNFGRKYFKNHNIGPWTDVASLFIPGAKSFLV
jgi:hypothetical protein